MKHQVAVSMIGFMLLALGYTKHDEKWPFNILISDIQSKKSNLTDIEDVRRKNIYQQRQSKNPSDLYEGSVFAHVDVLYWRADQEGLQYGAKARVPPKSSSSKLISPQTQWDPGFRIGVGYTFSQQDEWDLIGIWTRFQTHQSSHFEHHPTTSKFFVPWWGPDPTSLSSWARAEWNLIYNTYDLALGRSYFASETVSIHPLIGMRGATIDQLYHAKYLGAVELGTNSSSFKAKNNFWGIGARMAAAVEWYCYQHFSLIGQVGGSLLYANFHVKESLKGSDLMNGSTISPNISEHTKTAAANLEASLGVQWEKLFYQNKWKLLLALKYEYSEWFSQNRMLRGTKMTNSTNNQISAISYSRDQGDLALQGASFQVRLDF